MKIDRSFVTDLPCGQPDKAIARAVLELGHSLGRTVIAEGVETEVLRACMTALGCEACQGFLLSKPLAAPAFLALLGSDVGAAAGSTLTA